ncbi:hypothetical protein E4T38_08418 [Aureobasidium subglaciale]|nr:hypothetical protein E4T38_08418 [Aureobasidium subglaciale]KAI5215501.1 hypothetical protein E4T40_08368 [Aureobasidium subglaciale]KAI5218634.1 hypothetical protein E4T41_08257 [Aureobasidium subglaciale]KAI5256192.1 hypothetical protein E4T46_08292 [Aureobasidium subglaciale]
MPSGKRERSLSVELLMLASEAADLTTQPRMNVILVDPVQEEKLGSTLNRITMSRKMAGQAKYLCEIIESRYLQQKYNCHEAKCRARPSKLAPQERDEVTRAHHFVKLYALAYANRALSELRNSCEAKLRGMSVEDKHFIFQLTRIMHDYALPWDKMRLDLCYSYSPLSNLTGSGSSATWADKFKALQEATRVQAISCGNCIYDDTARFGRIGQGKSN